MRLRQETLRKVQLKELEILLEVKRICDENNIRYSLYGGTLLGAVRHKGFIPWDDDIEIAMLRKDYERFLEIAPESISSDYYIESSKTNPDYVYSFCKVKANNTLFVEKCTEKLDIHQGIWIDIFPIDSIEELNFSIIEKQVRKIEVWQTAIDYDAKIIQLDKPLSKVYFTALSKIYKHRLIAQKEHEMQWQKSRNANYTIDYNCIYGYKKSIFPFSLFEEYAEYEFEGHVFSGISNYDALLSQFYGDYMVLPPVEKRVSEHGIVKCEV